MEGIFSASVISDFIFGALGPSSKKLSNYYIQKKILFIMHTAVLCLALQGFAFLSTTIHPVNSAGIAELLNLNDIEEVPMALEPVIATNSLREALEDNSVGSPCHVEYKVTKREAGRCIKLGRGIRACASDTYLDPFHPECL